MADWVTEGEAQQALAVLGGAGDADTLVAIASTAAGRAADTPQLFRAACRLGGAATTRALLDGEDDTGADIAAQVIAEDASTAEDALVDLLHHRHSGVRRHALGALDERLDHAALLALIDEYPTQRTTYYYDVVCRLDWLLFAAPNDLTDATDLPLTEPSTPGQDQLAAGAT